MTPAARFCPLCRSDCGIPLLRRATVPTLSNHLHETREAARAAPTGELDLVACAACGFIYNRRFDPALAAYDSGYENDQAGSPGFADYLDDVRDRLLAGRSDWVLEIGCGQGWLLESLVARGAGSGAAIGYDAAWRPRALPARMHVERAAFDAAPPGQGFDLIYARHVIEHVATPVALLRAMAQALAPGGRVCLEVPSLDWILAQGQMQDFFYEHCNYFTAASLAAACAEAGLGPARVEARFGGQYLWAVAEAGPASGSAAPIPALPCLDTAFFSLWQQRLEALSETGPVALWGAAAKGVTFATAADPAATRIAGLIDINPLKQARYIPCSGHRVLAPDEAAALGIRSIIVMNPNYRGEIATMAERAGLHAQLLAC
jgi:SAM-dependent methyltransferase